MVENVKPRYRVPARSVALTSDSFQNFATSIGVGTSNLNSASGYGFNFVTRNRTMLEAAYRGSWIVGAACDIPADDMTSAGIELQGLDADETEDMTAAVRDLDLGAQIANGLRWGRLFGGAIAMIMIDGQDPETPLDLDTIGPGMFKGLHIIDRTVINPLLSGQQLVRDMGPSIGLPEFYGTFDDGAEIPRMVIHHSRAIRFTGVGLPYYQRRMEQFWGESIMERIWDRIIGFDSVTQGIVQLVYKAYLRVMKVKGLRNNIASGGAAATGLGKMFEFMRQTQSNEGLSIIDGDDEFEVFQYAFTGLDGILEKIGQQVCGALDIPYSRMFGQSPGGLSATGEGDMRNYDLSNRRRQETSLRRGWTVILDIMHRSILGRPADRGFTFKFRPLMVPTEAERKTIGKTGSDAIVGAVNAGIISQQTALRELRALGDDSGMFGSITDEEIDAAEETVPSPQELADMAAAQAPVEAASTPDPNDVANETGGPVKGGVAKAA